MDYKEKQLNIILATHLIIFDRQTGDCMIDALYMTDEEQGSALIPQTTGNMDRPEETNKAMDFLLDRIERVQGMNHN